MTRDELISLAEEAGFQSFEDGRRDDGTTSTYLDCWVEQLEKFAELVAAEQRKTWTQDHWTKYELYEGGGRMTRYDFILKYVLARAAVRTDGINIDAVLRDAEAAWRYAAKEQG